MGAKARCRIRAAARVLSLLALVQSASGFAQPAAGSPIAAASSAVSIPHTVPLKRELQGGSPGGNWSVPALLLGLTGVAGAALLVVRRGGARLWPGAAGAGRQSGEIATLGRQVLTPQVSVHALRWHGEDLLLSCTAQEVTVIARHPAPDAESVA